MIEDLGVNNGDMLPTLNTTAPKSPASNTREKRHSLEKVKKQKVTKNGAIEVHCSKQTAKELPLKCSSSMIIKHHMFGIPTVLTHKICTQFVQ